MKKAVIRTGLEALFFSGSYALMRPFVGGVGVILTFHHVRPRRADPFQPNHLLEVTPEFFELVAQMLRRSGLDVIGLDEMHRRMSEGDFRRRFVCVTFDDGYRDTLRWATPILRKYDLPYAHYIPTSFPDRRGELWWLALERVIARTDRVTLAIDGRERYFDCASLVQKNETFAALYAWLRQRATYAELRDAVCDLCDRYGVNMRSFSEELCMSWDELARLAEDPLVTIGAHTDNHPILRKMDETAARRDVEEGRTALAVAFGRAPEHFAYPVGDPTSAGPREFAIAQQAGFKTAVTTRPGVLFAGHAAHLMALPRISVNGDYQQMRYLRVLLSGAATAVWNGFRQLNVA